MIKHTPLVLAVVLAAQPADAQSTGRFHLVRSISGSKGAPDGSRYVLEDPRTTFQAGVDRKVMVTFEWEGPAGRHHCVGNWKDPSGKIVFTSEADVAVRGTRFGVYWGLSLSDSVATGTWVLEATVDGEQAGAHTFQIQKDPASTSAPTRRALAVAELYQRGMAQTLTLSPIDAAGGVLGAASGFLAAPDLVSTSFAGINGARVVKVVVDGHGRLDTSEVVSWNRRDDWALLRVRGASPPSIIRASELPHVGDRCFFLDAHEAGARVIVETTIIGQAGGELMLGDSASDASLGAPIFNEYGEVVASLIGTGIPGATALDLAALGEPARRVSRGARARAIAAPPDAGAATRTLADLEQAGLFVRPLAKIRHHVNGELATGVDRQGRVSLPLNGRVRFSRSDGQCVAFVTWYPSQKEDTTTRFELFDEDGKQLGASEPPKRAYDRSPLRSTGRSRSRRSERGSTGSTRYWAHNPPGARSFGWPTDRGACQDRGAHDGPIRLGRGVAVIPTPRN